MCLTVLSDNLSPGPLWSSSWCCTLYFILHAFLHPVIIFFSQHMPITMQPGHISNNNTKASRSNNTFTRHARTYTHIYALAHMHPVHMYASTYRVGQKTSHRLMTIILQGAVAFLCAFNSKFTQESSSEKNW